MDNTITFTYTLNNGTSGTQNFTGDDNCQQLRTYITDTIGDGSLRSTVRITTAILSGNGYGSANSLFYYCRSMVSIDLENFNTTNITNMNGMFRHCDNLISLDLFNFDISSVSNLNFMFQTDSKLRTIYCGDDWNIRTTLYGINMFSGCTSLVGAIPYDSSKTDIEYANPTTGYFTSYPLVVNGKKIDNVFVNGVKMTHVYVNGVQIM